MGQIARNIETVRERVEAACRRSGRPPGEVRLMAVTKTQAREAVEEAYAAGIRLFGENRIGEAVSKFSGFHEDAELHMIGHLQRNKVNRAAGFVQCVQSIDKLETAKALDRRCGALGITMEILLEVNTSGEESKEGFRSEEALFGVLDGVRELGNLTPRGLMTVAAFTSDEEALRRSFRSLARLREQITERYDLPRFDQLSMGMSHDYEIAIEEGATLVRVGSALFGPRETK